jgi:hypothetical protein
VTRRPLQRRAEEYGHTRTVPARPAAPGQHYLGVCAQDGQPQRDHGLQGSAGDRLTNTGSLDLEGALTQHELDRHELDQHPGVQHQLSGIPQQHRFLGRQCLDHGKLRHRFDPPRSEPLRGGDLGCPAQGSPAAAGSDRTPARADTPRASHNEAHAPVSSARSMVTAAIAAASSARPAPSRCYSPPSS